MPKARQSCSPKAERTTLHTLPVDIRKVRDEHLGAVYSRKRAGQVPHSRNWLLHKMDWGAITSYHYGI